ncbi:MAG: hypothetical protein QM650_14550 [Microlunatus sp.]
MSTRPLRLVVLAVLLAPLLAGACAQEDRTCKEPVTGAVAYYGSSVPPPYHVEWTITVDGDRGHFEVTPGYGDPQRWSADFTADHSSVAAACTTLAEADQVDAPPPGSAVITAELTGAEGRTLSRRTTAVASGEVYRAVRAIVPTATWDQVYGAYDDWSRGQ